jgi:Zn-dependent protease
MEIRFGREEITHLLISFLVITIAFTILFLPSFHLLVPVFFVSALSVGTAFLLHELAHKIVAQRYGCYAEFRAYFPGLFLAIFFSFFGFVFAAPGAVFILGYLTREQNGKIAAAGPLTNLLIAGISLPFIQNPVIGKIFIINSWLALFNLLPLPPLDGSKVIGWSLRTYILIFAVAIFFFLTFFF